MKAKLVFLAMPFYLGLVLAFALAACDGSGNSSSNDSSSSSEGNYSSPAEVKCEDEDGTPIISFDGFEVDASSYTSKIAIMGNINSPQARPFISLEFTPSKLQIAYNGQTGSNISVNTSRISLGGKTFIELSNSDCGDNSFTVKACIAKVDNKECCNSKNGKFDKLCTSSSSGGALSSSSEAVWKFGSKQTATFTSYNSTVTVGSISFMMVESGSEDRIKFMNGSGKIANPDIVLLAGDEDPEQGKGYSNNLFKEMGSPVDEMDLENRAFYVVYSGNEPKYLIRFDKIKDTKFPKPIEYWTVDAHP